MELCSSFRVYFEQFSSVFSGASYLLWTTLSTGWILSNRHHFISDMIVSSGSTRQGAWTKYYHFFSRNRWSSREVCRQLFLLIVDRLIPDDTTIVLAVDDTLCRNEDWASLASACTMIR